MVGYRRYEGLEAAAALGRLYAVLRLFVNFFQPSFKLVGKVRDGAKVSKTYHRPATFYQRLLADAWSNEDISRRATATYATLVALADRPVVGEAADPSASTLEQFLSELRTAWQDGEVRPTSKPKAKAPRGRRRPDPLARVTELLRMADLGARRGEEPVGRLDALRNRQRRVDPGGVVSWQIFALLGIERGVAFEERDGALGLGTSLIGCSAYDADGIDDQCGDA